VCLALSNGERYPRVDAEESLKLRHCAFESQFTQFTQSFVSVGNQTKLIRVSVFDTYVHTWRNFRYHDSVKLLNYRMREINTPLSSIIRRNRHLTPEDVTNASVFFVSFILLERTLKTNPKFYSAFLRIPQHHERDVEQSASIDEKIAFPRSDDKSGRRKRKKTFIIRGMPRERISGGSTRR